MATLGGYLNSRSPIHAVDALCMQYTLTTSPSLPSEKVLIVTSDSRILVGTLEAADQSTNLVLSAAQERVIQTPESGEPSVQVPLGLYLVRGDNVCTIGLVDEALDDSINWTEVKGSAIGGTKHV
ncbi:U6 snRNA-associated Sm-like protein LSm8 [Colletotrichum shisoi]|uniref:LSM2-LSM8 complex subunit LSM8 n=1 Tax=Colletotrichum shisoi TaxID=2078593 RepID=A0A5Q4BQ06_9PEZI|nr:U6 snRNA-associated Sm-like protein LSm8 [Colletotrichum shisoi]